MTNSRKVRRFKSRKFDWNTWDFLPPVDRHWLASLPVCLHWTSNHRISEAAKTDTNLRISKSTLEIYGPDHPQSFGFAERQWAQKSPVEMLADLDL